MNLKTAEKKQKNAASFNSSLQRMLRCFNTKYENNGT